MITVAIILLIVALAYKIIHDYKWWLKERHIYHKKEWWRWLITAATCSPSIVLFTLSSPLIWYIALPLSCGMCAGFIWLFFDGIYNLLRRENFFYTGTDDKEDAVPDDFLQALPLWANILVKTIPLGILIYLYINTL